ncbi:sulfite reductase flavoprotein subunit alpha [Leucobacter weissii]|uniref:Sulfite reductase flavoprotein subunit alpha n=1 Tax=Leucobacter weissii TaxID=1983706 RepID=A0A939MLL4_9MICO|nr:sulfite reductase flavoprotein subunit alpha [Leucobacter weissii]MBO1902160.1 sulfite reductase flavoprotein subunit alpha [Leucobacter weissii]
METRSEADLTILYGSQTGNAEFLAYNISEAAAKAGLETELLTLNDALQENRLSWGRLLIVSSTHDNGHMPDNADAFWRWLQSCDGGQYSGLPYAVLAIGDSMYDDFCKAGQDFDGRLAELGAVPMLKRIDCDVDFDMTSGSWVKKLLASIPETAPWSPEGAVLVDAATASRFASAPEPWRTARLIGSRELTSRGSDRRVLHYDLGLPDDFAYLPGDSVEILPRNSEPLVQEWVRAFPSANTIRLGDEEVPFADALRERLELRIPHIGLVNALITRIASSEAADRIRDLLDSGDRSDIDAWLWGRDVLDVVQELGLDRDGAQPVIDAMRPLQPRSYSIASGPAVSEAGLSLTVASVAYRRDGRSHRGAGTSFLESLPNDAEIALRRVVAHEFRLPSDEAPLIMIGPGVGVAPFIGFLHELEARRSPNETWLFFGDRQRSTDWLYESEMRRWQESGVLTRLDLAFSRDRDEKHYVQHEILTNAEELRSWIDRGAHIYICGDKNRMAHDVERALVDALAPDGAEAGRGEAILDSLRAAGRYAKDVY